jgi:hypothetical protein
LKSAVTKKKVGPETKASPDITELIVSQRRIESRIKGEHVTFTRNSENIYQRAD